MDFRILFTMEWFLLSIMMLSSPSISSTALGRRSVNGLDIDIHGFSGTGTFPWMGIRGPKELIFGTGERSVICFFQSCHSSPFVQKKTAVRSLHL